MGSICLAMAQDTDIVSMLFLHTLKIFLVMMVLGSGSSNSELSIDQLKQLDRNVVQMYDIVHKKTNCSFLSLLSLSSYGNWCGMGNNGQDPLDQIDQCCQHHDLCYDTVMNSGLCHLPHPLLVSYSWSSDEVEGNTTLLCDDCASHKSLSQSSEEEGSQCSCQTCMCDLQLATCLHATGKCPSPLFGILNRRRRK